MFPTILQNYDIQIYGIIGLGRSVKYYEESDVMIPSNIAFNIHYIYFWDENRKTAQKRAQIDLF